MSEVVNDKTKFQINLDVSHFKPEEIQVKAVENALIVEGKHEEKMDEHGYIARQFTRKYFIPEDVDAAQLASNLSPEGVLTIGAPKKALPAPEERKIPIQMGGKKAPEAIKDTTTTASTNNGGKK
jgi:crystallin alpha B